MSSAPADVSSAPAGVPVILHIPQTFPPKYKKTKPQTWTSLCSRRCVNAPANVSTAPVYVYSAPAGVPVIPHMCILGYQCTAGVQALAAAVPN